jgi:aspartate racemase
MEQAIGVIGGVGPYAGLDLVKKVFDNTMARSDQEHVDLYMTSCPSLIGDRTRYLLEGGDNPAEGILVCFEKLALIGATVIVIPCNTAHAPAIFDVVHTRAESSHPGVRLVNMIRETCATLDRMFPHGAPIGLLATKGTHAVGVYRQYIGRYPKLQLIEPDTEARERVHQAIYDPMYGIKAVSPVTRQATDVLLEEGRRLIARGAQAIILGCTELPLAPHDGMLGCQLVDPTEILARAALERVAPGKLRSC